MAADVHLRLYWWGGQARADRTFAVADLYTKANPGVAFDGEFNAFNDYWPKLGTQVAGGNAPDVIQMDYRFLVEYANRGSIAPLDEYVGKSLDLADFDKDQLDGGTVGGKLYAISLGANSVALMVNKADFEKAGIELPTADWTYDDYKAKGADFFAKTGKRILADGSGGGDAPLENWLRQKGKALYTADGKLAFDEADAVEWFKLWADLRASGATVSAEDQALDATAAIDTTMITLGKAGTTFANSNQLIAFQADRKTVTSLLIKGNFPPVKRLFPETVDNYAVVNTAELIEAPLTMVNFPRPAAGVGGGHYRKPSQFWSVNPKSSLIEDAVKFVSFFVNDVEAGKILGVERGIPCAKHVRDAVAPTLDAQSQVALNFVAAAAGAAGRRWRNLVDRARHPRAGSSLRPVLARRCGRCLRQGRD